jgi:hypothetical protein
MLYCGRTWIYAARDAESDTPMESPTTGTSASSEHFHSLPYGPRDNVFPALPPKITLETNTGIPASDFPDQRAAINPSQFRP